MITSPETTVTPFRWTTFRALRHRNFRLYWSGQALSLTGTWMQNVAQSWLVYRLTDSPFMLGLVNIVGLLPVLPVSLVAGVISDRFPRRKLILLTESVLVLQAFTLAFLTWSGLIRVWQVIVLTFISGAASALEQPARLAFIYDTVGKEDLSNAVALNSSVSNAGRIIGPAIAGLLVAFFSEAACFLVNGLSFFAVILTLFAIRIPQGERPKGSPEITTGMIKGLKYTWENITIRSMMLIVAASSFFVLPYLALMPVFARDVLNSGSQGLGFLMTTVGIGAIAGALLVATIQSGSRGKWLTWGNILSPLFLIFFCLSRSFFISLGLVLAVGLSNAVRQTLANSLIQLTASEDYHGRVMSIFYLLFTGMAQAGAFIFGATAEVIGAPAALSIGAVANILVGIVIIRTMPSVYRLE